MTTYWALLLLGLTTSASAQIKWCAVTGPEMTKCNDMQTAFSNSGLSPSIQCVQVMHESQCLRMIKAGEADVKSVADRGIYIGGSFSSLKPIISETRQDTSSNFYYKSVIVVKKSNRDIQSITDLKNKRSCHTGVMRTVGWVVPVGILYDQGGMTVTDCDNNVKNVANHFSQSCAPGAFERYNDPDEDNPTKVCQACNDKRCPSPGEKYSSYNGAFRGVVDGVCDAAFVKHSTVPRDAMQETGWSYSKDDYELLCRGGERKSVDDWVTCNWAIRPHNAIVSRSDFDVQSLKRLLGNALQYFGPNGGKRNEFQLFNSSKYGGTNLIFSDGSENFKTVDENDYQSYLGPGFLNSYAKFRPASCQKKFRWCTVSDAEARKCSEMRMAMGAARITQDMTCVAGTNVDDCFNKIQADQADLLTVDAGHVYTGGKYMNLKPISAELYDEASDAATEYYGVALIRSDNQVNLNNMRGKKTCHTGFGRTVGWNVPVGYFADRNDIKIDATSCNVGQAAANFFGDMCTPGALEGDNGKRNPAKLCSLCANDCQSTGGIYSGYSGAVRCLKEKGADVAFVKHTTIDDILTASPRPDWASGWTKDNFRLACPDGTIKTVDQWETCKLAKVPSHAVVTSKTRSNDEVRHYQIALGRAQSRYKADNDTFFAIFNSEKNQANLLFKDSTKGLKKITTSYREFLTPDYLRTLEALDPRRCSAGSGTSVQARLVLALLSVLLYLIR